MEKNKHLGIRVDAALHRKLAYVAEYDGRSINGEILFLVRQYIREFEAEHGKIEPDVVSAPDANQKKISL